MPEKFYLIGSLAKAARVSVETIRFYQREGLLVEPPKPKMGYRRYDSTYLNRVRFIRQMRDLGFSIKEIREWISFYSDPKANCTKVEKYIADKRVELERRLETIQGQLRFLSQADGLCGTCQPSNGCGVFLEVLKRWNDSIGKSES